MGVSGLLRVLKSITNTEFHISSLKGYRVAIDAHSWLHKGSYHCSEALALGQPTTFYVDYVMSWICSLKSCGIKEIMVVFDGQSLCMKENTTIDRRNDREENFQKAIEAKSNGDFEKAETYFQRSISINFEMIQQVITALKSEDIPYMIAPYEADAQLAFLSMNNLVDAVITEDSDVLIYGCRRVIYKLDRNTGKGHEILRRDLGLNKELSFTGWNDEQFVTFCCLVGCDYCPNLYGMGIKTAYKYASSNKSFDAVMTSMKATWKTSGNLSNEYFLKLWKAVMTFRYQVIYNPLTWKMKYLRNMSEDIMVRHNNMMKLLGENVNSSNGNDNDNNNGNNLYFLGKILDDDLTERLVRGFISPTIIQSNSVSTDLLAPLSKSSKNTVISSVLRTETSVHSSNKAINWIGKEDRLLSKQVNDASDHSSNLLIPSPETGELKSEPEDQEEQEDIWAFESTSKHKDQSIAPSSKHAASHFMENTIGITNETLKLPSNTKDKKTISFIPALKISGMSSSEEYHSALVTSAFDTIQHKKRRLQENLSSSSSLISSSASSSFSSQTKSITMEEKPFFDEDPENAQDQKNSESMDNLTLGLLKEPTIGDGSLHPSIESEISMAKDSLFDSQRDLIISTNTDNHDHQQQNINKLHIFDEIEDNFRCSPSISKINNPILFNNDSNSSSISSSSSVVPMNHSLKNNDNNFRFGKNKSEEKEWLSKPISILKEESSLSMSIPVRKSMIF